MEGNTAIEVYPGNRCTLSQAWQPYFLSGQFQHSKTTAASITPDMSNTGRPSVKNCVEKPVKAPKTIHSLMIRNTVGVAEAGRFPLRLAQAVDFQAVGGQKGGNSPGVSTRPREITAIIEVWQARDRESTGNPLTTLSDSQG